MITLIILNKEMEDIMKMIKSLVESGLSIKRVSKTNKNKTKVKEKWISWHVIRYIRC